MSERSSTAAELLRKAAIALVPPLLGFVGEKLMFASVGSVWLLLVAAVIVSAANGGLATGIVSTITSVALAWWYLIPPVRTFGAMAPGHYLSGALFIAIGVAISLLHERLRLTNRQLIRYARQNKIFAAFSENSLDFIAIADAAGALRYINPAGRRMIELPDDVDIEQTHIPDYYPPEDRAFAEKTIVAHMMAAGKWAGEANLRNWRTGASISVFDTHFLIRDPTTQQLLGIGTMTRDISAPKAQRDALGQTNRRLTEALAELEESQRFLQGILDYSPNAIVIKSVDGRYSTVNNGFCTIARTTPANARGRGDPHLFPAALAQRLKANDERAVAEGQAVVTEESVELGGERRVFVVTTFPILDESKTILALGSIWTDITQRKRDEESLRRAAEGLRTAQRVAHVGSFRLDPRTERIEWSEELYRIFGLDPEKPRTTPLFRDPESQIMSAEAKERLRAAVEKTAADGTPYEMEFSATRPDGTVIWLASRGEALRDEAGRIVGVAGTCADITKLKALERLRDEWTSVIAHDLRQPIGTVLMASELLPTLRANALNEEERKLAERIHAAGETLRRMVGDLLDMSLLESERLKLDCRPAKPADLIRQTIERLAHMPGIERVRVDADADLPSVLVDPMRIGQVLGNLISNAIKYGDRDAEITIGAARRADEIEVTVTNRGPGIAKEDLPQLFNRFVRSRNTRRSGVSGLGLGLYIAQGIVRAHGGSLRVASTPGETTTFAMRLPVFREQHQAA